MKQYLVDSMDAIFDKLITNGAYCHFEIWETSRDHARKRCWAAKTRQVVDGTVERVFPEGIFGAKVKKERRVELTYLTKIIYYHHISGKFYIYRYLGIKNP